MKKTFIVAIDPNKIYFEVEADTEKEARGLAINEIEQYFLDGGELAREDITVTSIA